MKKLAKILAVLLTVCVLAGAIAVTVGASTSRENNLIPVVNGEYLEHYSDGTSDFEKDAIGDITTHSRWSGQQGGADKTTLDWYIGGELDGDNVVNKYLNFLHYAKDTKPGNTSTVQPYLKTGDWDTDDARVLDRDLTHAYDYLVFDVEYGTDRYKYFDGDDYVTYTAEELAEIGLTPDSEGVSLAIVPGLGIYPQIRGLKDVSKGYWSKPMVDENGDPVLDDKGNQKTDANGQSLSPQIVIKEIDGEFYFEHYTTKNLIKMSNAVNALDHITIVVRITGRNQTDGVTKSANFAVDMFINGEYLGTDSRSSWQSISVDFVCFSISNTLRNKDAYSLVMDNATTNYYKIGYTSGDAYGLDDYYKSFSTSNPADFTMLDDVVYNRDYVAPDYITLKDNSKVYNHAEIKETIKEFKGYNYILSNTSLYDLEVSPELEQLLIYTDKNVSFKDDGIHIFRKIEEGYEICKPTADDMFKINWYNANDDLIATTDNVFGQPIDGDAILPNYADVVNGKLFVYDDYSWIISVNDEVSDLRPIEYGEIEAGATIEAYLEGEEETINVAFFVGMYDESTRTVRPIPDSQGGYGKYASNDNLLSELILAPNDATVVMCSDYDVYASNTQIGARKTVSLDLNGYDILRLRGETKNNSQPGAFFKLDEGSYINIYSSRIGGRIFDSMPYTAKATGTFNGEAGTYPTEDVSYSSSGFIACGPSVDECGARIGAFRGYEANIEYNGGSLFYANGKNYRDNGGDWNELVNDKKRTFIIDGGEYYMPARPAYALATTTGPDVVFDFKNADFYVSNSTYALFHDYEDGRFSINTETHVSNCNIIAYNADNIGKTIYKNSNGTITLADAPQGGNVGTNAKVFYYVGKKSTVYIEDCNIVGQLYNTIYPGGQIILGDGNVISSTQNILASTGVKFADGISAVQAGGGASFDLTLSFAHPKFYADYEQYLEKNDDGTKWVIKEGIFDTEVTATVTKAVSFVTMEDEIPEIAKDHIVPVKWYDPNGSIFATTYAFKNGEIKKIEGGNFAVTELDNGWYDVGYGDWTNITEGQSGDSLIASADKENKFAPKQSLIADIEGTKAKMAFFYSQYEFYFYFPKPAADSGIIYHHDGSDPAEINKTGWFSSQSISETSAPYNATGYLKSEGNYYYNFFYPNQDAAEIQQRAIRFRVEQYDLNGDGNITEDEKNIVLVQNVNISIPRYATLILNHYGHGSEETNLSYALMSYMMETRKYMGKSIDFFEEYENAYFAKCDCEGAAEKKCEHVTDLDSMDLSEETSNIGDLTEYLHSANFNLNISKPNTYFYLLPIEGEYDISVNVKYPSKSGGSIIESSRNLTVTRKSANDVKTTLSNGTEVTLLAYSISTLNVQWLVNGYNITITANYTDEALDDVTVSGKYGLADYVNNNPDVRVAKALYAYAWAIWDYKVITKSEQ